MRHSLIIAITCVLTADLVRKRIEENADEFKETYGDVMIIGAGIGQIQGTKYDTILVDDFHHISPVSAQAINHNVWHEPAPKKIPFKQAQVRQSFRQSMRSVNRNR